MSYTGTGGLKLGGCADISVNYTYIPTFNVRDVVYDCHRAALGYLDAVAIKKIRIANGLGTIIYVDTFNRSWNEVDLCEETTARNTATAYWNRYISDLELLASESC